MKPRIIIGYVDSWQIRDKKDVHPSHRTAIVELEDIREIVEGLKTLIERLHCIHDWAGLPEDKIDCLCSYDDYIKKEKEILRILKLLPEGK